MNRKTLDYLLASAGLVVAVVLVAAGGLLTWAHVYVADQVHDQLAIQAITMPEKDALETADQHAALDQYAGQEMLTGAQAQAYADHYIKVHMNEASGGKTYSEVSGQYIQQCSDPKQAATEACQELGGLRQTLFMGDTLRGLLLYGSAFATIGTVAGYAAIAAYVAGVLLLVLVGLGFWHSRRAGEAVAVEAKPVGAHG